MLSINTLQFVSTRTCIPCGAICGAAVEQLDQQQMLTSSSEPSTDLPEYLSMDLADILLVDSIDKVRAEMPAAVFQDVDLTLSAGLPPGLH